MSTHPPVVSCQRSDSTYVARLTVCAVLGLLAQLSHGKSSPEGMHAYTVQAGDTLIGLGDRLLTHPPAWKELAKLNRIAHHKRMPVGSVIQIPLRLLKSRQVPATVISSKGETRLITPTSGTRPVQPGDAFDLSEEIQTGSDGYVTVRLADGSEIRIQPSSIVRLERTQHYEAAGFFRTRLKLIQGRVDSLVKRAGSTTPSLEIQTPQATMGVRGTEFRTIAGLAGQAVSAAEVLSGTVMAGAVTPVHGGYGVRVEPSKVPEVVQLLPAPVFLPAATQRQERLVVHLPLADLPKAKAYRVQLARDAQFQEIQTETVSESPDLRLVDVPDGTYRARVRGIDAKGLEGMDAVTTVVVKAHPQAPMATQPSPQMKIRAHEITFGWSHHPDAATYRLQVAAISSASPAPSLWVAPLIDQMMPKDNHWTTALLPGDYLWRMASIRPDGDQGPWGDPLSFSLRPPPAGMAAPQVSRQYLMVQWSGEPGQTYEFQASRQPDFSHPWFAKSVSEPHITLARPEDGGPLYLRYRAIDADGFVGPFTVPQLVDLPTCLKSTDGTCLRDHSGNVITSP